MTKAILASLLLSLSFSGQVFAQEETTSEGETKMKIEDAADKKNKVEGDIDQEIVNKKLRAESGSKSKYSLSMDATYTGGSVTRAFGQERPNLYGRPGTQRVTSLTLGPDVRYRWTKNDSLTFGTSLGMNTPFQGDVSQENSQLRVGDPTIGYSRVGKIGAFQSIAGAALAYGTSPESLDIDQQALVDVSWNLLRTFQNGLSLGLVPEVTYTFYKKAAGNGAETGYGQDDRTDYDIAFYPYAEYELNDTFSLRTVARYTTWYHMYGDEEGDRLLHYPGTQSVGLGMSLARDLHLYPNVQFMWEDIKSDRTNVAMTATMNVF
jgi:hypothetical protein